MALSTHRLQIFSQYSQQIQILWKPELENESLCEGDYSESHRKANIKSHTTGFVAFQIWNQALTEYLRNTLFTRIYVQQGECMKTWCIHSLKSSSDQRHLFTSVSVQKVNCISKIILLMLFAKSSFWFIRTINLHPKKGLPVCSSTMLFSMVF